MTSDSVVAWIASRLGARRLVLLKSAVARGAPAGCQPLAALARPGSGRPGFSRFSERILECWVVNSGVPECGTSFLTGKEGAAARVIGRAG